MTKQYVVDTSVPFKGRVISILTEAGVSPYTGMTLEQIKAMHPGAKALTLDEFSRDYYQPYIKSLQKPFVEVTREHYEDILECLPPINWTRLGSIQYFFCCEAYTDDLHALLVKKNGNYYEALRPVRMPKEDIMNEIDQLP